MIGLIEARPTITLMLLLGFITVISRSYAYDLFRMVLEDDFRITINWTPHYLITWLAYAATTLVVVEGLLLIRDHVFGRQLGHDELSDDCKDRKAAQSGWTDLFARP